MDVGATVVATGFGLLARFARLFGILRVLGRVWLLRFLRLFGLFRLLGRLGILGLLSGLLLSLTLAIDLVQLTGACVHLVDHRGDEVFLHGRLAEAVGVLEHEEDLVEHLVRLGACHACGGQLGGGGAILGAFSGVGVKLLVDRLQLVYGVGKPEGGHVRSVFLASEVCQ